MSSAIYQKLMFRSSCPTTLIDMTLGILGRKKQEAMERSKFTRLNSKVRRSIVDALLNAFPDLPAFARILDGLEKNLHDFTHREDTRESGIVNVVDVAERQQWLRELLVAVDSSEWGKNDQLVKLKNNYPYLFEQSSDAESSGSGEAAHQKDFRSVVRRKFLAQPYADLSLSDPKDLEPYRLLMRHLVVSSPVDMQATGAFFRIAESILSSRSSYPLRVEGAPGSGKSSFLSIIYLALDYLCLQDPGHLVLYVDLHRFESEADASKVLGELFKRMNKLATQRSECEIILFLDGIDDYASHGDKVGNLIKAFGIKNLRIKRVLGIGSSHPSHAVLFDHESLEAGEPEHRISLRAVPIDSGKHVALIEDFLALKGQYHNDALVEKLTRLALPDVDLRTLSTLDRLYIKVNQSSTTDLLEQYCRSINGLSISSAAALAFHFAVHDTVPQKLAVPWNSAWRLVHWNPLVRDFLVAWHIQDVMDQVATGHLERLQDIDHVYPWQISRFSKELVTRDEQAEYRFLRALQQGFENAGTNARSHMAYLAGRLTKFGPQQTARQTLRKWRSELVDVIANNPASSDSELLLARTIYISLVDLGDEDARERYLECLVDNPNWNDLNRGFHLEYYGDLRYQSLTHRDPVEPNWSRTFSYLLQKVSRDHDHPRFEIELFTLFSLAQHRHAKGMLSDEQRTDLKQLAERFVDQGLVRSGVLRPYLVMMRDHLEQASFRIGEVANKLYELKGQLRTGWAKRKLTKQESVAEHVFGALLLAYLYLPPANLAWPGYDKRAVLRMLFAHDLAEAFTGDIVNKSDVDQQKEREMYEYIGVLGTYDDVNGARDLFRSFQEFDQRASVNSRIANDIDRLENLMQLFRFRDDFADVGDFNKWRIELVNSIHTQAGREILKIIEDTFAEKI